MVTTREQLRIAQEQAKVLEEAARSARDTATRLLREGVIDEPEEDGAVVRFTVRMPVGSGTIKSIDYQYAAIRAKGKWFITGSACPKDGFRWERLWQWINGFEIVGDFEQLFTQQESW